MKRTFLDFKKTSNTTAVPATGEIRMLIDNNGQPKFRDEGGSDVDVSIEGHTHSEYAAAAHNHDGDYLPVGYDPALSYELIGNVTTAYSVDMDGGEYKRVSLVGDTAITLINETTDQPKRVRLYVSAAGNYNLTFPATWQWDAKPPLDVLALTSGQTAYIDIVSIGGYIVHAKYQILET